MPKPKIFTVPELRHSTVSADVRTAARYGPHGQGAYLVLAHSKADALARLRELNFPVIPSTLRVARDGDGSAAGRLAAYLAEPGDVVTAERMAGRRLVRVPAGTTAPVVLGTWRYLDDPALPHGQRYALDTSKEGTA